MKTISKNTLLSMSSNNNIKITNESISCPLKQADQIQKILKKKDIQPLQSQNRLRQIFKWHSIDSFFINIEKHLNDSHIITIKKNHRLLDGIYILLTGYVIGFFMEEKQKISTGERQLRQHLFSQLKNGNYNNTFNHQTKGAYPYFKGKTNMGNKFTLFGLKAFDVIQCVDQNYLTTQDCVFITVNSYIQSETKFQRLKRLRSQKLRNNFLPFNNSKKINLNSNKSKPFIAFQESKQPFIPIIPQLHQNIKIKKYYFRNQINVSNFGIVSQGTVKLCKKTIYKENQPQIQLISQNGIILSSCSYQAVSQNVQIFQLKNINILTQKSLNIFNSVCGTENKPKYLPFKKMNSKSYHSKSQSHTLPLQNLRSINSKQIKKRNKEVINVSKDHQKYSIISMFTCQRSYNFSKQVLANGKSKVQKTYDPLVLFDLRSNPKSKTLPFSSPKNPQTIKNQIRQTKAKTLFRSPTLIQRLNKRSFRTCSSSFYDKQSFQKMQKQQAKSMHLKQSIINMPFDINKNEQKQSINYSKLYKFRINKKKEEQHLNMLKLITLVSFSPNYDIEKIN